MSSPYVSSATGAIVNSNTIPSDGDTENAASVDVPFETLADDIYRVAQGARVLPAPVTKMLLDAIPVNVGSGASTNLWYFELIASGPGSTYTPWHIVPSTTSDGQYQHHLWFPIRLPHGASLTQAQVLIQTTAHTVLPGNTPIVNVYEFDLVAGTSIAVAQAAPTWTLAAYSNARLTITLPQSAMPGGNPITIDRSKHYWLEVISEWGANASSMGLGYVSVTASGNVSSPEAA